MRLSTRRPRRDAISHVQPSKDSPKAPDPDPTLDVAAGLTDAQVRKKFVSAQKLGRLQPFIAAFPQECLGQLASFGPT